MLGGVHCVQGDLPGGFKRTQSRTPKAIYGKPATRIHIAMCRYTEYNNQCKLKYQLVLVARPSDLLPRAFVLAEFQHLIDYRQQEGGGIRDNRV